MSATSGSTTHRFVYDPDGRVLGEYGTSASDVIAETIWMSPDVANDNEPIGGDDGVGGYAPLALATGSGSSTALTWLHGNHLGVPIVFTDVSGIATSPPSYTLPGFPGQMKTLSDIYYNRHRDYDSSTGRYIQADPIGLEGGQNIYLYAQANPMKYRDPEGLAYFAYRPLDGSPFGFVNWNRVDDFYNLAWAHEQLFFKQSGCMGKTNIGFFEDSSLKSENRNDYHRLPGEFDDELMCEAVQRVTLRRYRLFGNNCQNWADDVQDEYYRLLAVKTRRRNIKR